VDCQDFEALKPKQHRSYADRMNVFVLTRVSVACLLLGSVVAAACASGGVPRPHPFPGAPVPRSAGDPTTREGPARPGVWPAVVATALTLRGVPYTNGGSEPARGFDCSGLVQWVFAQHGTALPRQTHEQFEIGDAVDPNRVEPGDLIFFRTRGRTVSHVGIALGDGEFVHAPNSRGVVRVERYTGSYWSTRLMGVRRVPTADVAAAD